MIGQGLLLSILGRDWLTLIRKEANQKVDVDFGNDNSHSRHCAGAF